MISDFNQIKWGIVRKHPEYAGKHSIFFTDADMIHNWLGIELPSGYGLKVFKSTSWQGTEFKEVATIQNIFWIYGLAPRVLDCYQTKDANSVFWVSIVEYLLPNGGITTEIAEKLQALAEENYILPYQGEYQDEINMCRANWRQGKYLDFGGWKFIDKEAYQQKLVAKINQVTHFGKAYLGSKASYQSIPDWKVDGKRKTDYRIQRLGLAEQDFENKSVLDIGCNLGMFLNYAHQRGAISLTGYDLPAVIDVAREFANYQQLFRFEFHSQNLAKDPPKEKADIVFFLAMREYLGLPDWLPELTNEVCYYEGHAKEIASETETRLKQLFPVVKYLGETDDRSVRPLFVCYKQ